MQAYLEVAQAAAYVEEVMPSAILALLVREGLHPDDPLDNGMHVLYDQMNGPLPLQASQEWCFG